MNTFKKAFTMIELVFVIVIIGILSAVAMPKLSVMVEDANFASAKATVSSLRSAISSERQRTLMTGSAAYPLILDDATKDLEHQSLFDGNASIHIMQYPIYSKTDAGGWMKTTDNSAATIGYRYYINSGRTVAFTYTKATGIFDCDHTVEDCRLLSE